MGAIQRKLSGVDLREHHRWSQLSLNVKERNRDLPLITTSSSITKGDDKANTNYKQSNKYTVLDGTLVTK
ncbi:AAEL001136-PA [Aedes aegypti]|uniref:AAEL001136-PA n=1 Tax=Aedes aegypti TaxID=7159 RepID=Q17M38_AEDAE|nr:AAEL001136-PA [Aedes aegypti]